MTDIVGKQKRSHMMSRVRHKNTGPEILVRSCAHKLGLRYRLHKKELPGSPDLVFPRYKLALFVHGCFWHRHEGCKLSTMPKSNTQFWREKFSKNVERDRKTFDALTKLGWNVRVIWQCEVSDKNATTEKLKNMFGCFS